MIQTNTETPEVEAEAQRLRVSCLNNLAACHFQWGHHTSCIQLSSAVLDINSQMVKALYRSVSNCALYIIIFIWKKCFCFCLRQELKESLTLTAR